MLTRVRQVIATGLSLTVLLNSLASAGSNDIWADRKTSARPVQVAALPTASSAVLQQLPSVIRTPIISDRPRMFAAAKNSRLQKIAEIIPTGRGTIHKIFDAKNQTAPVVLLEDVHLNTEAQANLSEILQSLADKKAVSVIGVEGAFGAFNFSAFRDFPSRDSIDRVAKAFLNNNWISAPTFVGMTTDQAPTFYGVDDLKAYGENVKALWEGDEASAKAKAQLEKETTDLAKQKSKVFSAPLLRFDSLRNGARQGSVPYSHYIEQLTANRDDLDPVIEQFLAALKMEKSMDFARVDAERRQVVERLSTKLSELELSQLLQRTMSYRSGSIGFGSYYDSLKKLCADHGVNLRKTPAFDDYIRYVLLADGINSEKLFAAVRALEQQVATGLVQNEQQRKLLAQSERLALEQKLVEFSLTAEEWSEYQSTLQDELTSTLSPFIKFYRCADIRSDQMLSNLVAHSVPQQATALVVGGFHTDQLTKLLRSQQRSFIVISPKITKVEGEANAYLSIFNREKASLNSLFVGEKLFLSPATIAGIPTDSPVAREGRNHLLAAEAADAAQHQALNPEYKVTADANQVHIENEKEAISLDLNRGSLEVIESHRINPASLLNKFGKLFFHGESATYRIYTRWIAPLWETFFFGVISMHARDWLGYAHTSPYAMWSLAFISTLAVLSASLHQFLNDEKSDHALLHWFVGSALIITPFVYLPSFAVAAALSFGIHLLWNHIPALTPLSFGVSLSHGGKKEILELIELHRGLIFSQDANFVQSTVYEEATKKGLRFVTVRPRNRLELARLKKLVHANANGTLAQEDGPLVELIKNGGILFIDYSEADPKAVEELNSLYDPQARLGSQIASNDLHIVAVLNPEQFEKYPVSFYSRFWKIIDVDQSETSRLEQVRAPPHRFDGETVELFESPYFRQDLIGHHTIDETGRIRFTPGALTKAVKERRDLTIKGANWEDPDFVDFINDLLLTRKFESNGVIKTLPTDFKIYREDGGYAKREIKNKEAKAFGSEHADPVWIVNKLTQDILISRSEVMESGALIQHRGILEEPSIRVRITESVSDWVWHRLLHSSNHIEIEVGRGVAIPKAYRKFFAEAMKSSETPPPAQDLASVLNKRSFVVQTNDLKLALSEIKSTFPKRTVTRIPVTAETKDEDLIARVTVEEINGRVNETQLNLKFVSSSQDILKSLRAGNVVVLEGLDSNPLLFRKLETLLHAEPYVMENNQRINLADLPGQLIVTCKSLPLGTQGIRRGSLKSSDGEIERILKAEFKDQFKEEDFKNILKIREVFSTLPRPSKPGLYPDAPNFSLSRLEMLYRFKSSRGINWLDAFENVYIADYEESPSIAAFLRTAVRVTFDVEHPGLRSNSVAGKQVMRLLSTKGSIAHLAWRYADCFSVDLLKSMNLVLDYQLAPTYDVAPLLSEALAKSDPSKADYYRSRFYVGAIRSYRNQSIEVSAVPTLDPSVGTGTPTWEERKQRCLKLLGMFNIVFLKGAPGTGKSYITKQLAEAMGYSADEIEGPITVGADAKNRNVVGRYDFNGRESKWTPEAVHRWRNLESRELDSNGKPKKLERSLLIVDEANLTDPSFWNMLKGSIDERHQVIFTGNPESVTGRRFQDLIRDEVPTVYFPEFDEAFFREKLQVYVPTIKKDRNKLIDMMLYLDRTFRNMGPDLGFSLRDIEEMAARVQILCDDEFNPAQVLSTVWQQYRGLFNPEQREALRTLFIYKYGLDVAKLEAEQAQKISDQLSAQYRPAGLALVPPMARSIKVIRDFLALRDARLKKETTLQGKRGIIFDAPPARGKDRGILATLLSNEFGFRMAEDAPSDWPKSKILYHRTASPNYDELFEVIRKAQREGSVVLVSELNLLPTDVLEGKLNDLLTGNAKEGFAFFATVNSTEFSGREVFSTALQNRVIYERDEDYNEDELTAIARFYTQHFNNPIGLTDEEISYAVKGLLWIRDHVSDPRYRPTIRELKRVIQDSCRDLTGRPTEGLRSIEENFNRAYGPFYLARALKGQRLPTRADLLRYKPKHGLDTVAVLEWMGRGLLPSAEHPFQLKIDASNARDTGGYIEREKNAIVLRAAGVSSGDWLETFRHELGHGFSTRDVGREKIKETPALDPLMNDLEDLRQLAALDHQLPYQFSAGASEKEKRLAEIIATLNVDALMDMMTRKKERLTQRLLYQHVLVAIGMGLVTDEQVKAMAQVLDGVFEANPLALAYQHRDRARDIRAAIPQTLDENEVQYQQYVAHKLILEIAPDYLALPDEEEAPDEAPSAENQSIERTKGIAELREKSVDATIEPQEKMVPVSSKAPTAEDIAAKREQLRKMREQARTKSKESVEAQLELIRSDLKARPPAQLARLEEMLLQLTDPTHPKGTVNALKLLKDESLTRESERLIEIVRERIDQMNRLNEFVKNRPVSTTSERRGMGERLKEAGKSLLPQQWTGSSEKISDEEFDALLSMVGLGEGGIGPRFGTAGHTRKQSVNNFAEAVRPLDLDVTLDFQTDEALTRVDPKLADLNQEQKPNLEKALESFVANRMQLRLVPSTEGVLDLGLWLADPIHGFLGSGGSTEEAKSLVVITGYDGRKNLVRDAAIGYLVEEGFKVATTADDEIPDRQIQELKKKGSIEVISVRDLEKKVGGVYLAGAAKRILDKRQTKKKQDSPRSSAPELSPEQQVQLAQQIFLSVKAGEIVRKYPPAVLSDTGINLEGSAIKAIDELEPLTYLRYLNLAQTDVRDLSPIEHLANLQIVNLAGTELKTIDQLIPLAKLSELHRLFLDETFDKSVVYELIARHPNGKNLTAFFGSGNGSIGYSDIPQEILDKVAMGKSGQQSSAPTKTPSAEAHKTLTQEIQSEMAKLEKYLNETHPGSDISLRATSDGIEIIDREGALFTNTNQIPPTLAHVTKLYIGGEGGFGSPGSYLSAFPNLKHLEFLRGKPLTLVRWLEHSPKLESFVCSQELSETAVLVALANHPNQHQLKIKANAQSFSEADLKPRIKAAAELVSRLGVPAGAPIYSYNPSADEFWLIVKDLSVDSLDEIARLDGLYALTLSGTKIIDLRPLSGKKEIRALDLSDTNVFNLAPIKDLPLTELALPDCIAPGDVAEFLRESQTLQQITVIYEGKAYQAERNNLDQFLRQTKNVRPRKISPDVLAKAKLAEKKTTPSAATNDDLQKQMEQANEFFQKIGATNSGAIEVKNRELLLILKDRVVLDHWQEMPSLPAVVQVALKFDKSIHLPVSWAQLPNVDSIEYSNPEESSLSNFCHLAKLRKLTLDVFDPDQEHMIIRLLANHPNRDQLLIRTLFGDYGRDNVDPPYLEAAELSEAVGGPLAPIVRILPDSGQFSLNLSGSSLSSLDVVAKIPGLFLLDVSNTQVRDLSPLWNNPTLEDIWIPDEVSLQQVKTLFLHSKIKIVHRNINLTPQNIDDAIANEQAAAASPEVRDEFARLNKLLQDVGARNSQAEIVNGNEIKLTIRDEKFFESNLPGQPFPAIVELKIELPSRIFFAKQHWEIFPGVKRLEVNQGSFDVGLLQMMPRLELFKFLANPSEVPGYWKGVMASHPNRRGLKFVIGKEEYTYSNLSKNLQAASDFAFSLNPSLTWPVIRRYSETSDTIALYLLGTTLDDLEEVAKLQGIDELYLAGTKIKTLEPLRSCKGLRILVFDKTDIGDLIPLWHLPLEAMVVPDTVPPQQVADFLRAHPKMTHINVSYPESKISVALDNLDQFLRTKVTVRKVADAGGPAVELAKQISQGDGFLKKSAPKCRGLFSTATAFD